MHNLRQDHELLEAVMRWGGKYHYLSIPTEKVMPNERYLPHRKFYVPGFDTSPFGVEWMRFDKNCPLAEIIKTVAYVAFEVEDIDMELLRHGFEVISEPAASLSFRDR